MCPLQLGIFLFIPHQISLQAVKLSLLYQSFSHSGTRSAGLKLKHNIAHTNKQCHFYFNRICRLWNSLPIINLNLSTINIKNQLRQFFWKHFTDNFNATDSHKLHYLCPCGSCINNSPTNFNHL